jgi:hypothetical protein
MPFRKAKGWGNIKPPMGTLVDRAHPLGQYARVALAFNDGAGRQCFNAARPDIGATFGVGNSGTTGDYWDMHQRGRCIRVNNAGTFQYNSTAINIGNATGSGGPQRVKWSIAVSCLLADLAQSSVIFAGSPSGTGCIVLRADATTGVLNFVSEFMAVICATSSGIAANTWYDLGVSYDGTNGKIYVNGTLAASGSSAQTFTNDQFHVAGISLGGSLGAGANSRFGYFYLFDGVILGQSAFQLLRYAPYDIFLTPRRRIISGAGGGPTFNAAWAVGCNRFYGQGTQG